MAPFITKNGYPIYRCTNCTLKQTDLGEPYEKFITNYYAKAYFTGGKNYGAYADYAEDKWFIVQNMKKFLAKIKKYKKRGKLLDVGCALGFFVELASQNGFDAYGFDPSDYAVAAAKRTLGDSIKHGTIQSISYPKGEFDVITMFDVVEHLGDPIADLQKLIGYLKDDGIIIIATGNADSLSAKLFKRRWTFYIPPQHTYFFTKKNFQTVLGRAGLRPIEWFGIGKWMSFRYVLNLARSTGESLLGEWLYKLTYKLKLGRLPIYLAMRDNMVVVARKSDIKIGE